MFIRLTDTYNKYLYVQSSAIQMYRNNTVFIDPRTGDSKPGSTIILSPGGAVNIFYAKETPEEISQLLTGAPPKER